jgi:hypothetical protein
MERAVSFAAIDRARMVLVSVCAAAMIFADRMAIFQG